MQTQHISALIRATSTLPDGTPESQTDRPLSEWVEKYKWRFDEYHPALKPVMPAVKRFCSDVIAGDVAPYWLTILGPSGVGKTLAQRQAFRMLSRNEHLWPIRVGDHGSERFAQCAHIQPGRDLSDYRAPKDYGDYDLLYVEDIGAGSDMAKGSGSVTASRVIELLQYRPFRWTLICANMDMEEIEKRLDPRVASRLIRDGSVVIEIPKTVPDYNMR